MRELTWKSRFVVRLTALFVQGGQDTDAAIADAIAYASKCYPQHKDDTPELEAEALHRSLQN
ncbi:MAG: hypothetical protein P4L57_12005 [Rhizomicrobium sp.]|nr:hypothetical protein [Rhizomicrobium sp.]